MAAMTIAGRQVDATAVFDVINPATGEVFAQAPDCSAEQLDEALEAAHTAFLSWRETSIESRRDILKAMAARIREKSQDLARLITLEQGKPLDKAVYEIMGSAMWCEYSAGLEIPSESVTADGVRSIKVGRKPWGVVAAITPWNFPVMEAIWKIAPALLTGNTVVLKPSPYTPMSSLELVACVQDLLPPGVLSVVTGTDAIAPRLTTHPRVRKISFTGSINTGKKVFAAAAEDLKGLVLELGGNDPAVVLEGADPKAVAPGIFMAAFANAGQVCAAIKRVYVHASIHDEVVAELVKLAGNVRLGDGLAEGVTMGPLNNRMQYERVLGLLDTVEKDGGKFVVGGPGPAAERGYFIAPSIVTGLSDASPLVAEEQFGPVLPVLSFTDTEDAIARANGTPFGLSASVWGADVDAAVAVAERIEAGTVWVNQHMKILPMAPTAGVKWSGIGAENGPWGLEEFLQLHTIEVAA